MLIALIFIGTQSYAQFPLAKNNTQFNAGIGLSVWGLPVCVGFDYGAYQNITIRGEASFRSYHSTMMGVK